MGNHREKTLEKTGAWSYNLPRSSYSIDPHGEEAMRRKILLASFALLVILFSCLLFVTPYSPVQAQEVAVDILAPTPTLDPVQILNQANAAATQAANAAIQSNTAATTVNTVASGLNITLFFFSVLSAVLGVVGTLTFAELTRKVKQVDSATAKVKELVGRTNANLVETANEVINMADSKVKLAIEPLPKKVEDLRKEVTYLLQGYQLLEQGKKDQAIKAFEMVLQIRPAHAQANYALGRIYSGGKSYARAIGCLKAAIGSEHEFPEAHMELGLALRRQADQQFEEATQGKKDLNDEVQKKALKQRDDGYLAAIQYLKEAETTLPGDEDILGALGGIYRRWGVYQTALAYYQDALSANPNSSYARGNVASLSYHVGNQQIARQAFEDTIALATKRIDAHDSREPWWDYYGRAMAKLVLRQIGDATKKYEAEETAIEDYNKAIELTLHSENFESVLSGLNFLGEAQSQYNPPGIPDMDEVITLIKTAKVEMEAREKAQKEGKEKARIEAQPAEEVSTSTPVEVQSNTPAPEAPPDPTGSEKGTSH